MLMDGFFAVTDVLEPHRLFLPAALPVSASPAPPSVVAGGVLLPEEDEKKYLKVRKCVPRWTVYFLLMEPESRNNSLNASTQIVLHRVAVPSLR